MSNVYLIVSMGTPFDQYWIWGVASSHEKAEIAIKTIEANKRAYGLLEILPLEMDELCADVGMTWRIVMKECGGDSQATIVKWKEDQWPISHMECGSFLAFVDTEFAKFREDAVSEANKRRIAYKEKLPLGIFYDIADELQGQIVGGSFEMGGVQWVITGWEPLGFGIQTEHR